MLGLLLIYFIGKKFYDLADEYDLSTWKYAIFGVIAYYIGTFFGGVFLGIIDQVFETNFTNAALGIVYLPFGVLSCYLLYMYYYKKFLKQASEKDSIDDIGNLTD